jgi:hypothetical protein
VKAESVVEWHLAYYGASHVVPVLDRSKELHINRNDDSEETVSAITGSKQPASKLVFEWDHRLWP